MGSQPEQEASFAQLVGYVPEAKEMMNEQIIAAQEWKEILAEAYKRDRAARELMDKFNERILWLQKQDIAVDADVTVNRLYADMLLAVRAYLEGKVFQKIEADSPMH